MKKLMFIFKAAELSKIMTENEWKEWVLKEGAKVGFTEEELREALFH